MIKRDLKVRPVQKYLRSLHEPYIQFLGIAANETDRLNLDKNCRSILNEQGIIEAEAFEIAFRNGLLSPTYDNGKRGGCWFCPSAPVCEFARTKTNHKELWEGLARLDKEEDRVSPYFRYNKTFSEVDKEGGIVMENIKKKIPSIKILPEYFEEVLAGRKRAELRLNDREYKKGDIYDLREWNPKRQRYTGRKINIQISHVLENFEGLKKGWCVFSFKTYEEIFGKDDEPTCKTLSIDYEAEYHRCVGTMANIHNEREEAKSAVIALSAIITEQRRKIAELEKRCEDEYWRRRD